MWWSRSNLLTLAYAQGARDVIDQMMMQIARPADVGEGEDYRVVSAFGAIVVGGVAETIVARVGVARRRALGDSWADIGAELQMSKQAAQQRYGAFVDAWHFATLFPKYTDWPIEISRNDFDGALAELDDWFGANRIDPIGTSAKPVTDLMNPDPSGELAGMAVEVERRLRSSLSFDAEPMLPGSFVPRSHARRRVLELRIETAKAMAANDKTYATVSAERVAELEAEYSILAHQHATQAIEISGGEVRLDGRALGEIQADERDGWTLVVPQHRAPARYCRIEVDSQADIAAAAAATRDLLVARLRDDWIAGIEPDESQSFLRSLPVIGEAPAA